MPRCSKCNYYSDKTSTLKRHLMVHDKKSHDKDKIHEGKKYACLLCRGFESCRSELMDHITSVHDVVITKKHLTFENEISFLSWKTEVERDTASRFVKHRGIRRNSSQNTVRYYCHRDGVFSSQGTGKRRLKRIGSNKINSCCPARISAAINVSSGYVNVEFVETHVGHTHDLGRLHLSKDERKDIAAQIAAGVPFKDILKEVKKSVHNTDVDCIHLLTSKDLWNIQQEFNLKNDTVRHQDVYASVHSWATENEKNQVVRFYKQQGFSVLSHPELLSRDFILIIANESQLAMLEQFGSDCVCVDGIHGLNQHDFQLTTIFVLDELRQGFPCAFMFSNRTDAEVLKIFFKVIADELDSPITPHVLMSDVAKKYRNAWLDVMPPPDDVLFSTWHIDSAWKKNLSKVKDDTKKAEVYKTLRALLEETDEDAFERLLESALFSFESDPDKEDFGEYFKLEYGGSTRQWAFCYQAHLGLGTNMHLESLHKTIKRCYFEGKKLKRLDKCLHVLMRVIRDKLVNRVILSHRGKLAKQVVSDIWRRHAAALQMKNVQLCRTKHGWSVSCNTSTTSYSVVPWNTECKCDLRCVDCDLCLHSYKCECLDSSIKWMICRHIHFMAIKRAEQSESLSHNDYSAGDNDCSAGDNDCSAGDNDCSAGDNDCSAGDNDCSAGDNDCSAGDNDCSAGGLVTDNHHDKFQKVIVKELYQKPDPSTSFESMKKMVVDEFRAALEFARSMEDIETCRNAVRSLIPTMKAARSTCVRTVQK